MKYKILGIIICMVLISSTPTLAVTPFSQDKQQTFHPFFNRIPVPFSKSGGWMKTFGRSGDDAGICVQTTDGGYIIIGSTQYFGPPEFDVWLIKIDSNGIEEWNRTFGEADYDFGVSGQQTKDGGYIITGSTGLFGPGWSNVLLIKTDNNGNEQWNRTFGGTSYDEGSSVQQTTDGGYIITGYTYSFGVNENTDDVWLIKTDGYGNEIWNKTFGGVNGDEGSSVQQTTDGGYIIVGYTDSFGAGEGDVWLIKTDSTGEESWNKTFGWVLFDEGSSVQQTLDSGYIIIGSTTEYPLYTTDVWLIKTDANGNKIWDKRFGRIFNFDFGSSVQQTTDNGFIITGTTIRYGVSGVNVDVYLIKTNSNGKKMWDRVFDWRGGDFGYDGRQTSDGGYIISASTPDSFGYGYSDILLIKTDSQGKVKTLSSDNLWFERLFQRFPNAFPILRQLVKYTSRSGLFTQRWSTFTTKQDNNPPNKPSNPSPPNQATDVDINTDLSWTGGDPDVGDTVTYDVYFGSGFPLQKVAANISTLSYDPGTLAYDELYRWSIVAWDSHGLSTQGLVWWFRTAWAPGHPPNKPSQPSGQTNGIVGQEYVYTTSTTDPDGDQVYYLWDWGDGNNSGWSQAYFSGTTVGVKHKWTSKGSYSVKVKAKDMLEQESSWSDPLAITMPYSYKPIPHFLELLFQRFPNAFPLLRHLLQ